MIRRAALILIRLYQLFVSPLLGSCCRHLPTCSEYTGICISRFGLFRGALLGAKRLGRCHPWGTHGYDPPPPEEGLSL